MSAFALIPVTRPRRAVFAARSAERLGWETLCLSDAEGHGPCWMRNELLWRACELGADIVRYVDDDDLAIGISADEARAHLAEWDVISFDYLISHPVLMRARVNLGSILATGHHWTVGNFCARVEVMKDHPWPVNTLHEASRMALAFVQSGLRVRHIPTLGYFWNTRTIGLHTHPQMTLEHHAMEHEWALERAYHGR